VNNKVSKLLLLTMMLAATGCANHSDLSKASSQSAGKSVMIDESYLSADVALQVDDTSPVTQAPAVNKAPGNSSDSALQALKPIAWPTSDTIKSATWNELFSTKPSLRVSAEDMPLLDFLHYVFGELLAVNYVFDQTIDASADDRITLSVVESISPRALYDLTNDLLTDRGLQIKHGSNTFYLFRPDPASKEKNTVIGVGGEPHHVPNTSQPILQVVSLKYGPKISLDRNLMAFGRARMTTDHDQGVVFIQGARADVLQGLELIKMLDTPSTRSQHIGLIELTYITPDEFSKEVAILLENEGVMSAVGTPKQRGLVMVPLQQLGGVAVFAVSEALIDRVNYWSVLLDVPGQGSNEQYFLYHPKYARAIDLGKSVGALLGSGGGVSSGQNTTDASAGLTTGNAPASARTTGLSTDKIKMVVDERANALVFYTSGSEYQALMPLLAKLDTLPKQVSLDITIAEVTLQDEFKFGVEWALSRSEVTLTTQGAFGASAVGGLGVIIDGYEGPLTANFLNTNNLVKVLSNPTIMVRDGVQATINVGSDISVVGATTQDPINGQRQTTTSEYRKTGVDVTVTPTVNAQGIVVMEVSMSISNSVPSSTGASGNPDIFERLIETEVVAQSGQTIMLGGLISENYSSGGSGAPGLASIPLLGNLFKSKSDSTDRTELIMLITPQVQDSVDRWDTVKDDFQRGLKFLQMQ
jgi:general secretion pathway protein D